MTFFYKFFILILQYNRANECREPIKPKYIIILNFCRGQFFEKDSKCYRCGNRGHIERDCRNSRSRSRNRSDSRRKHRSRGSSDSPSRSPSRDRKRERKRSVSKSRSRSHSVKDKRENSQNGNKYLIKINNFLE